MASGLWCWFHGIDLSCPQLELAVRSVQRCSSVNAQGVCGLLKLLLSCFLFIPSITLIITGLHFLALHGFSFTPKGFARVICFITSALTASDILTFFLITLLIFSPLPLDELLNLMTLLEIVAFGLMNLAIRPIAFPAFSAAAASWQ